MVNYVLSFESFSYNNTGTIYATIDPEGDYYYEYDTYISK
jgi:hypothetical protein